MDENRPDYLDQVAQVSLSDHGVNRTVVGVYSSVSVPIPLVSLHSRCCRITRVNFIQRQSSRVKPSNGFVDSAIEV